MSFKSKFVPPLFLYHRCFENIYIFSTQQHKETASSLVSCSFYVQTNFTIGRSRQRKSRQQQKSEKYVLSYVHIHTICAAVYYTSTISSILCSMYIWPHTETQSKITRVSLKDSITSQVNYTGYFKLMARFHSSIYIAFLLLLGYIQGISGFGKLTARGIFSSSSKLKAQYKGFDDMLANINQPVLVDFYAEWLCLQYKIQHDNSVFILRLYWRMYVYFSRCGPCKMLQPVLETVAQRLDAVAKVAKVDTEKSPKLAAR